jgi:nucleotide-binding universal stress UspA family protein
MNEKVACMVRGGEAGRKVQEYTIAYSRTNHKSVVFVHVVDIGSLSLTNEALHESAREELTWLAHVNLSIARRRAESAGVKAEVVILYGNIFEAIQNYLRVSPVDLVLMGAPHPGTENFNQRLERVREFAARLSQSTNVPAKVINTYTS